MASRMGGMWEGCPVLADDGIWWGIFSVEMLRCCAFLYFFEHNLNPYNCYRFKFCSKTHKNAQKCIISGEKILYQEITRRHGVQLWSSFFVSRGPLHKRQTTIKPHCEDHAPFSPSIRHCLQNWILDRMVTSRQRWEMVWFYQHLVSQMVSANRFTPSWLVHSA